jgi:hypothetical protein
MTFLYVVCSIVGFYILVGLLSLFNIGLIKDSNETYILLILIVIGLLLKINSQTSKKPKKIPEK